MITRDGDVLLDFTVLILKKIGVLIKWLQSSEILISLLSLLHFSATLKMLEKM